MARPLSTTVSRYHRLNLSRRRGNAVREALTSSGIIERISIATRSGQVVLYQLTDLGRKVCTSVNIAPGRRPRESLEHSFWVNRAAIYFEKGKYKVLKEHPVKGNGAVDILAKRPGQTIAVEVETGKSNTKENLNKIRDSGFDRVVLLATSPVAVVASQKAMAEAPKAMPQIELWTWLDLS